MKRYPKSVILLHWLLAPMVFMALFMGNDIAQLSNDLDLKVDRLIVHLTAGMTIGLLFFIRLVMKMRPTARLEPVSQRVLLNRAASFGHHLLYALAFGVVLSGIGIAVQVDMANIVEAGKTMPPELPGLVMHAVHGVLTKALLACVVLHIIAALYHQFILKDKLLSRIWFN